MSHNPESFAATVAYGRLGIILVAAGNLAAYAVDPGLIQMIGVACAAVSAGAAYVSQSLFTRYDEDEQVAEFERAQFAQLISIVAAAASGFAALVAA